MWETGGHPDVDGLDVGDARQRGARSGAHRGRREHGEQTERDARRRTLDVEPERHPRQNDDKHARNVDLDHEVADVATQNESYLQARKSSCTADTTLAATIRYDPLTR